MNHCGIEEIEYSLELPIGTRFYFRDSLFEAVGSEESEYCCEKCAFYKKKEDKMCQVMNYFSRDQKIYFFFKEVTEAGGQNNG